MEKSAVRIVAGSLRGRKVACTVHANLRPTPQMVREALFSILGNAVPGRVFYDVFAGTGVVGMEAVSRGASAARLIERDPRQASTIQSHLERFGITNRSEVIRADAYRWAERWMPPGNAPVNLFLSPPFADLVGDRCETFLACVQVLLNKAPDDSVLIIQAEQGFPLDALPDYSWWDIRSYGRNLLMFRVKGEELEPPADSTASDCQMISGENQ